VKSRTVQSRPDVAGGGNKLDSFSKIDWLLTNREVRCEISHYCSDKQFDWSGFGLG